MSRQIVTFAQLATDPECALALRATRNLSEVIDYINFWGDRWVVLSPLKFEGRDYPFRVFPVPVTERQAAAIEAMPGASDDEVLEFLSRQHRNRKKRQRQAQREPR